MYIIKLLKYLYFLTRVIYKCKSFLILMKKIYFTYLLNLKIANVIWRGNASLYFSISKIHEMRDKRLKSFSISHPNYIFILWLTRNAPIAIDIERNLQSWHKSIYT